MASSIGGLRTPNGAVAPRVRQDIEDLAADVDLVSTPTFATTALRDTAYASAIAAGKVGMSCYVTNRAGVCRYMHGNASTKGWKWEPQQNVLLNGSRPSAANSAGVTPVAIILMSAVTLPPGNRLVKVTASTVARALTGPGMARAYVSGTGIGAGNTYESFMQSYIDQVNGEVTCSRPPWLLVVSGSVSWNLYGISADVTKDVSFVGSFLNVIDLGPTDI